MLIFFSLYTVVLHRFFSVLAKMSEDGDNVLSDDEQYGTINCFDEFVAEEEIIDDLIDEALVSLKLHSSHCHI